MSMTPNEIRSLRTHLNLGQAEFAQMLGVHPMTVSRWEREKGALSPTAYQEVLMKEFKTAVSKDKAVGDVLKGVLIGAGIAAAIFLLLSKSRN
ncbi:MAG: helix-turn-helix domain-containing protein [Alphaproteobacteria bacterium]|nr:helix-turn-helix domain-containing protein [Alphaproteobacteria bacterium]